MKFRIIKFGNGMFKVQAKDLFYVWINISSFVSTLEEAEEYLEEAINCYKENELAKQWELIKEVYV